MKEQTSNNGIGFIEMLTILFIGLKLSNIIDWRWEWVLSPIWISIILVLLILLFVLIGVALHDFFTN